jgi:alkylhydroperoxidase/carboxymuconolactone decarboxylase family protein YurZ
MGEARLNAPLSEVAATEGLYSCDQTESFSYASRNRSRFLGFLAEMLRGRLSNGLELMRMATNNGATKEEITETLQHLAPYANFSGHLGGSEHY